MTRRMTMPRLTILAALAHPRGPMCGIELMAATDLPSGTVYPVLDRLRRDGLTVHVPRRGNRVYFALTDAGRAEAARAGQWAREQLAEAERRRRALEFLLALLPTDALAAAG